MKPEAQRIAIAEACGWTFDTSHQDWREWSVTRPDGFLSRPLMGLDTIHRLAPDYLNSLDSMAEAEKALTDEQWDDYVNELGEVTNPHPYQTLQTRVWKPLIAATAAQRCEAFLRTIGKWEESP